MSLTNRSAVWAFVALAAAPLLGRAADDEVAKLIDTLKDTDRAKATRAKAIDDLASLGGNAKAAVPALTECLKDPSLCGHAVLALGEIGPGAKEAMPALLALLRVKPEAGVGEFRGTNDPGWTVLSLRPRIIESMCKIGLDPARCVPALAAVIADDDPQLRFTQPFQQGCLAAVKALEPLGPKAKDAVPALIQLVENRNAWQWNPQGPREAMVLLGKIGRDAEPALPALRKRLDHQDPSIAKIAEDSIQHIKEGVARKPAEREPEKAADEPRRPRPRPVEAEDPEKPSRTQPPPKRRVEAEEPDSANAELGKLIGALGDGKAESRDGAIEALTRMGGKAVPALEKAVQSPDADVRKNALACLCKMGKDGRAAVPACIAALKDPSAEVRRNAAYALGRMRADSREAVAALTDALNDKDREVRLLAAFALEKARGEK